MEEKEIFKLYIWKKQSLEDLSELFKLNTRTIQDKLDNYEVRISKKEPRNFVGVVDSTFFGKRKDKFGVAVVLDTKRKDILKWKYIKTERKEHYDSLKISLKKEGFIFQAVVIDSSKPLFSTFSNIPIQIYHFHQKTIIRRYLTTKPKLQASKELKLLVSFLGEIEEKEFIFWFNKGRNLY